MCFQICVIIEIFGKRVNVMGKIDAIETHVKIFSFVLGSDSLVQNCNLCKPVYGIKTIHYNMHHVRPLDMIRLFYFIVYPYPILLM